MAAIMVFRGSAGWRVRFFIAALACMVGAASALAQTPSNVAAPPFEIVSQNIDLEAAPDGRSWLQEDTSYRPINTMGVQALQQATLSFTAGYETLDVIAYTLKKDGRRLEVAPGDILRGHGETTKPGFEDSRTLTVVFPNVEIGDQVVLNTTRRQLVPWFADMFAARFAFPGGIAVHQATVAFTTQSNDSTFHISMKGLEADPPRTAGGKTRRVWHFRNDAPVKLESDAVMEADVMPHVDITNMADYGAVAKLYANLFRDKTQVTPDIQALADKLVDGIRDRRGRARAIYD